MMPTWRGGTHEYASLPTIDPDLIARCHREEVLGELLGFNATPDLVTRDDLALLGERRQASEPSPSLSAGRHIQSTALARIHCESQAYESHLSSPTNFDRNPTRRYSGLRIEVAEKGNAESLGYGKVYRLGGVAAVDHAKWMSTHSRRKTIGALAATAICGNDITASCFYVVGELSANAGIYAPICTILTSLTLACFRGIYGEVVMALPLNGGIYNLLLNSSTKRLASVAACLTILSYTATGVVSSVTAANYFIYQFSLEGDLLVPMAVLVLFFFASLMLLGMRESSLVASIVFMFHLFTLFMLVVLSIIFLYDRGFRQFEDNMAWSHQPPMLRSIFFGFSSAMLGVSGFETSSNFVEEQKPGVFPKTLTNMWASVSLINISLSALAIMIMPLDGLTGEHAAYALASMADHVAGPTLKSLVSADALAVLCGSVLTSYVGVIGLILRMAGDGCLPEFLAATNSARGTPHWAILAFFCICASMCVVVHGDITMLATIYSLAFFLVMGLFAFCGLYMKVKRPTLPRPINTHPVVFVLGCLMVTWAFAAVYVLHPAMLNCFCMYFGVTVLAVMLAFTRVSIYTSFLFTLYQCEYAQILVSVFVPRENIQGWIVEEISRLWHQSVVYFTKHPNLSQINRALQYIEENEEARCVRIVHVYPDADEEALASVTDCVRLLDAVYPKIRMDCVLVHGEFGPAMVEHIAHRLQVPVNCMFMNCPQKDFRHTVDELRGVRIILNSEKSTMLERFGEKQQSNGFQVRRHSISDDMDDSQSHLN